MAQRTLLLLLAAALTMIQTRADPPKAHVTRHPRPAEPPPSTGSNMVNIAVLVVLGAVIIIEAMVAFVLKSRRKIAILPGPAGTRGSSAS
uniref:Histocompatibility 2, blastocyst n=1 Tax=Mus spicilegus TaxID=10103 RepID=A0A8C6I417_MUSSI